MNHSTKRFLAIGFPIFMHLLTLATMVIFGLILGRAPSLDTFGIQIWLLIFTLPFVDIMATLFTIIFCVHPDSKWQIWTPVREPKSPTLLKAYRVFVVISFVLMITAPLLSLVK